MPREIIRTLLHQGNVTGSRSILPVPFLEQVFLHFTSEGTRRYFHFMDFVALVRLSETIACSCVILSEWVEVLKLPGALWCAERFCDGQIQLWLLKHAPGARQARFASHDQGRRPDRSSTASA